ncbi:MAG: Hsp20/alpha crystallin family protein [Acidobacteriota bacterium]|nr:MAG: Hsp20/alpha crystallin family protein [Acidobacteriota bacterium]
MKLILEPLANLGDVRDEIARLVHGELRDESCVATCGGGQEYVPPVDIREQADAIVLKVDLPGVNPDAIQLTVDKQRLVLAGRRNDDETSADSKPHLRERRHGSFHREFVLPATVAPDQIDARFEFGVLTVTIPKLQRARPRRITVTA